MTTKNDVTVTRIPRIYFLVDFVTNDIQQDFLDCHENIVRLNTLILLFFLYQIDSFGGWNEIIVRVTMCNGKLKLIAVRIELRYYRQGAIWLETFREILQNCSCLWKCFLHLYYSKLWINSMMLTNTVNFQRLIVLKVTLRIMLP